MKFVNIFFLLIGVNSGVIFSQNKLLSKEKINLVDAFEKLELERKIHLAYDPQLCKNYYTYSWSEEETTSTILENLLGASPFNFKPQEKNHYLIYTDQNKIKMLEAQSNSSININIKGKVIDKETKEALISALVILMPDGQNTITDLEGNFELSKITKKENSWIEVRYLGYQTQSFPISKLGTSITVSLTQNIAYLPAMEIKAPRPVLQYTSLKNNLFDHHAINLPIISNNVFNDPVRSLQLLPGVNATEDKSVGLQIRGSNAEENLILLNGLMLFNVDHFYGIFSSINPYAVSEIQFYKSYFPANLGGRSSSVIKFQSPKASQQTHGGVDLNLITGNAYLIAPIGKKISLLAAARTTIFNIGEGSTLNKAFRNENLRLSNSNDTFTINSLKPDYKFNDLYSKLDYQITNKIKFCASYFNSFDKVVTRYESDFETRDIKGFNFTDTSEWKSNGVRLEAEFNFNPKSLLHFSYFRSAFNFDQIIRTNIFPKAGLTRRSFSIAQSYVVNNNFRISDKIRIKDNDIEVGVEYNDYITEIDFENNFVKRLDINENNREYAPFINSNIQITPQFNLNPGIRLNFYKPLQNIPKLSPRISLNYKWNALFTSTLNYGLYYQYLRQARFQDQLGREYYLWTQADFKTHPILKANQIEFIHSYSKNKTKINLELYYKYLNGITEYLIIDNTSSSSKDSSTFVNLVGNGKYYGFDFSLEQRIKNYSCQLVYSYNNSTNSFEKIKRGEYFQKPYVRQHQVKLIQNISFKNFALSVNGLYGSSLPYININVRNPKTPLFMIEERGLDDFLRFDIDLRYNLKMENKRIEFYFSVLNLFDQVNLKYVQNLVRIPIDRNIPSYNASAEVENLRRTMNIGIGYHF